MPNDFSSLQPGTKVRVKMSGTPVDATFLEYSGAKYNNLPWVRLNDGRRVLRQIFEVVTAPEAATEVVTTATAVVEDEPSAPRRTFSIGTRFDFLSRMVAMVSVANGPHSLIITGPGGLGKTYTVQQTLTGLSLEEGVDFHVVRGHSTPKSLYRVLYEHREEGAIIVFDDCDSVLKNETAVNLLKAALDTNRTRTVSWLTESAGERDGALPTSFTFCGKVIFISNQKLAAIPQPLLSRAVYVDVSMTASEKLDRMEAIAPQVRPDVELSAKLEVVEFMREIVAHIKDLNIRTMLKVLDIRLASPNDWREISEYVLTA